MRFLCPTLLLILLATPVPAQEPPAPAGWEAAALFGFVRGESGENREAHTTCYDVFLTPGAEFRRTWRYGFIGTRGTIPLMPQVCEWEETPPPPPVGNYTRSYWRGEIAQPWPHLQATGGVTLDHPEGVRYTVQVLAGLLPVRHESELSARPSVAALVGLGTVEGPFSVEGGCSWDRAVRVRDDYEGAGFPGPGVALVSRTETAHWPRLCGAGVRWRVSGP